MVAAGSLEYASREATSPSRYFAVSQEPDSPLIQAAPPAPRPRPSPGDAAGANIVRVGTRDVRVRFSWVRVSCFAISVFAMGCAMLRDPALPDHLLLLLRPDSRASLWRQGGDFRQISKGTCKGFGMSPITDQVTCQAAARGLGFSDTTVRLTPDIGRPEGCYVLRDTEGDTLWLSTNEGNKDRGASASEGSLRNPLCESGPSTLAPAQGAAAGDAAAPQPRESGTMAAAEAMKAAAMLRRATSTTTPPVGGATPTATTAPDAAAAAAAGTEAGGHASKFGPPSTRPFASSCLRWQRDGCYMITDRGACLSSRDGRTAITWSSKKIHGQPCVWCGGRSCTQESGSLCEPYDWIVKDPSFDAGVAGAHYEVASCPDAPSDGNALLPSLFCFALMLPFGYEPLLLRSQLDKGVGIFDCDEFVVFSNVTFVLSHKGVKKVLTMPIPGDLSVVYGGKWMTALNTDIFIRVWNAVSLLGRYQLHDWTVKADPDSVFFPSRLRELVRRSPMSSIPAPGNHSMRASCGYCKLDHQSNTTCTSRVQSLQRQGRSCGAALAKAAAPPPADCGCDCGDLACNVSASSMYLNNCKFGLHGPIEVVSREGVATYIANLHSCEDIRKQPFGEDKYLRRCLERLGVRRVDQFSLLSELNCGQHPPDCTAASVAFHPFKKMAEYFDCWTKAMDIGQWP